MNGRLIMTLQPIILRHYGFFYVTLISNMRVCVCSWNLPGPENYALQYADGVQTYITESVSHIYCMYTSIQVFNSESVQLMFTTLGNRP